jgi:uncharacterized protein YbjT (DUF2867 family)
MTSVVTGAFGYIGKYIAAHLLQQGEEVRTITTHPDKPNPFGDSVRAFSYDFGEPERLAAHLTGADVLFNTYWIRFEYGGATFQQAIQNTETLFQCARQAGIRKIVHISVTNAAPDSTLPYYAGKGQQEQALVHSALAYSIIRPTLVFGKEDILVNNIAWLVRKFPVFPIFGDGNYHLQPVFVEDLAQIAVSAAQDDESTVLDATGPEDFQFRQFVHLIASRIRPGVKFVKMSPALGIGLGRLIGMGMGDVLLTRDELRGLMDGMLTSSQAPNATTSFSSWYKANYDRLGWTYSSEIERHFKWQNPR